LKAEKIEQLSWYNLQELLEDDKLTYKIHKTIANHIKYDAIVFLSYHDFFEKKFRKIIKSKNKNNILDPFNYYS